MAAEIRPFPDQNGPKKLSLLNKLDGHQDVVNQAILLRSEDGVISISDDKYVFQLHIHVINLLMIVIVSNTELFAFG